VREGASRGLDATRLAVAGESVGGNMTAALTLLAKERGDVSFVFQTMWYPVADAAMDTASFAQFADGPFLPARTMAWFWDQYTTDPDQRAEISCWWTRRVARAAEGKDTAAAPRGWDGGRLVPDLPGTPAGRFSTQKVRITPDSALSGARQYTQEPLSKVRRSVCGLATGIVRGDGRSRAASDRVPR